MVAGTNDTDVIRLAVEWAEAGVPAFPIAVGWDEQKQGTTKRPLTRRGHHDATTDVQELSVAFMDVTLTDDEVLGVGLVPGAAGYVVFDADVLGGKRGLDTVREMGLPDAYRAHTASGGMHFWLRKRDAGRLIGNASPWTDVDVRGDGGWVVAPGVETPWGSWAVAGDSPALADAPDVPEALWGALSDYAGARARATAPEVQAFLDGYASVTGCRYGLSVLDRLLEEVTAARVHEPGHHAAMRIGELMRAGCLGADAMRMLEMRWLGFKPGSEAEWGRSLAAAAASDKADPPCDHRPQSLQFDPESGELFGPAAGFSTLDDATLADRFLDEHRAIIRYVIDTDQFSVYDSGSGLWSDAWRSNAVGEARFDRLLKHALQAYGAEAAQAVYDAAIAPAMPNPSDAERAAARREAKRVEDSLRSTRKRAAVAAAARAEASGLPGMAVESAAFDAHPYLLADPAGVIDLRTGERRPHDPALLLTRALPVAYDPAAGCEEFDRFLGQAQPTAAERAYLQRREGSTLIGRQLEHVFHVDLGDGRNGKGVLGEVVTAVLGPLAGVAPSTLLMVSRNDRHEEEIARLRGLRRVWIDEARDARSLDAARVKAMSGGTRRSARFMRANSFEYEPSDTIILSTNQLPKFEGSDGAFVARLRILPWEVSFHGREDLGLGQRIIDHEAAGVVRWLVEGAMEYLRIGLSAPESVLAATAAAASAADPVQQWAVDNLVPNPQGREIVADLYDNYRAWLERFYPREHVMDQPRFGRDLAKVFSSGAVPLDARPGKWKGSSGTQQRGYNGVSLVRRTVTGSAGTAWGQQWGGQDDVF